MATGPIRGAQDFYAGVMFIAFGAAALYFERGLPMGSAMRMGPGFFPIWLGRILMVLGLLVLVRGLIVRGPEVGRFAIAAAFLILSSVALFAYSVERAGIVVAVALVTVLSALPSGQFRWHEVLILTLVMIGLAVGLFTYGLGLPFPIFPA